MNNFFSWSGNLGWPVGGSDARVFAANRPPSWARSSSITTFERSRSTWTHASYEFGRQSVWPVLRTAFEDDRLQSAYEFSNSIS